MRNPLTKSATVMVVDDDIDLRNLLIAILDREGLGVVTATNGIEALELMRDGDRLPDLILTDVNMPGMGGIELFSKLKSKHSTRTIPIVIVSGVNDLEAKSISMGANDFLKKPYTIDAMTLVLKRNLH